MASWTEISPQWYCLSILVAPSPYLSDSQYLEQHLERGWRAIADSVKAFNNLVLNLEVDLDGDKHKKDAFRLANLEQLREKVLDFFYILHFIHHQ